MQYLWGCGSRGCISLLELRGNKDYEASSFLAVKLIVAKHVGCAPSAGIYKTCKVRQAARGLCSARIQFLHKCMGNPDIKQD